MATISQVIEFFEQQYPSSYQEIWDNTGLIIGNSQSTVSKVLLALDCNENVLDEAIKNNCELIITHHPLIFKGINKISMRNANEKLIYKAIKNDVAIIAMHTNVDNHFNGINSYIALKIGLENCQILQPIDQTLKKLVTFSPLSHVEKIQKALFEAGAGHIGNYSSCSFNTKGYGTFMAHEGANPYVGSVGKIHHEEEIRIETIFPKHLEKKIVTALISSHPYEEVAYDIYNLTNTSKNFGSGIIGELNKPENNNEFLTRLKKTFSCAAIKHSTYNKTEIYKVAICSGSGSFLMAKAAQCKADAFITADLKYHDFAEANPSTMLVDIGHFESEIIIKELFRELLIKNFPKFAILVSETEKNPVQYF